VSEPAGGQESPAEPYEPVWVRALIDDRARLQVEVETLQRQADMYRALHKAALDRQIEERRTDPEFEARLNAIRQRAQRLAEQESPAETEAWEHEANTDHETYWNEVQRQHWCHACEWRSGQESPAEGWRVIRDEELRRLQDEQRAEPDQPATAAIRNRLFWAGGKLSERDRGTIRALCDALDAARQFGIIASRTAGVEAERAVKAEAERDALRAKLDAVLALSDAPDYSIGIEGVSVHRIRAVLEQDTECS
jgi:hypothetical protein